VPVSHFEALTMPFKDFDTYPAQERPPFTSIARPALAPIYRTSISFDIRGMLSGWIFCPSFELSIDTHIDKYDIVILSATKALGEELKSWDTCRYTINIMLVKWTGVFAERIAIGQMSALVPRADENGNYWGFEDTPRIGSLSPKVGIYKWKMIQLV